jgi:hypothetical protein
MTVRATRMLVIALCVVALAAGLYGRATSAIQQQRSQIGIGIIIDVTPGPVAMAFRRAHGMQSQPQPLHVAYSTHRLRAGEKRHVPSFILSDGTIQLAQAQGNIPVRANVTPNPSATLLYSNTTSVEFGGVAGASTRLTCAFTLTVDTAIKSWTLDAALAQDFIDVSTWPGRDLSYAMYASPGPSPRPSPEATAAYVVYPDNNNTAVAVVQSGLSQVYCVDLTIFIPPTIPSGSYSTTAIYTLLY